MSQKYACTRELTEWSISGQDWLVGIVSKLRIDMITIILGDNYPEMWWTRTCHCFLCRENKLFVWVGRCDRGKKTGREKSYQIFDHIDMYIRQTLLHIGIGWMMASKNEWKHSFHDRKFDRLDRYRPILSILGTLHTLYLCISSIIRLYRIFL